MSLTDGSEATMFMKEIYTCILISVRRRREHKFGTFNISYYAKKDV